MGFLSGLVSGLTFGISDGLGLTDEQNGSKQQKDANRMAMKSWQLANDYNHPIQQMERLKAAGLNPNLVYGSGNVAGNTTSAPSLLGGSFKTDGEMITGGLQNIVNLAKDDASIQQMRAGAQASSAAAGASGAQAANLQAQAAYQEQKNKYAEKSMIADIDYKQALADKTRAEADITQGEASLLGSVGGAKGAGTLGSFGKTVLRGAKAIFGR